MTLMTYTGTEPIEQPALGLTWTQGQTQDVPEIVAAQWDADDSTPFSGPRKKAARDARMAAAEMAAADGAPTIDQPHDEQPAETAPAEVSQ